MVNKSQQNGNLKGLKGINPLEIVKQINKPAKKKFTRQNIIYPNEKNEIFQADLVSMLGNQEDKKHGYKYILTIIDLFSRKCWAIPLKNKSPQSVRDAWKKYNVPIPDKLHTDRGTEFYGKAFKEFLEKNNSEIYSTQKQEINAPNIERLNRTLRNIMGDYRIMHRISNKKSNFNFSEYLPEVVDEYNNRKHSAVKGIPNEIYSGEKERKRSHIPHTKEVMRKEMKKPKYKEGDYVRISNYKQIFDKRSEDNWSDEVFKIDEVVESIPVVYYLQDLYGEELTGKFYFEELQKVDKKYADYSKNEKHWEIEKIVKKVKGGYEVKWKGFDKSENTIETESKLRTQVPEILAEFKKKLQQKQKK